MNDFMYINLKTVNPDPNIRHLFKITKSYYHLGEKKFIVEYLSVTTRKILDWLPKYNSSDIESIEYVGIVKEIV
jgi:hypothetical protein